MTLVFTPTSLTRFYLSGDYATNAPVDLSATQFASVPAGLLAWLGTQIKTGESISQIVIDDGGQVGATFTSSTVTNPDGTTSTVETPATFRQVLNASVTVIAPAGQNGQRTFSVSSESLASDLRDELLSAWGYVASLA